MIIIIKQYIHNLRRDTLKVKDLIRVCTIDTRYKFYFNINQRYVISDKLYNNDMRNNIPNLRQIFTSDIIIKDEKLLEMDILNIQVHSTRYLVVRLKTDKHIGCNDNRQGRLLI